ncbi:MAG: UDP-N-acetylglucosamine 1-carboxyvinyltransferase [Candidatus Eiseniibacteriota bacterium]|nr:MAG: UDP-N-acetylglucosamine 1-carboxyvinyltransferase [Candidatus Eisenbacteria bacterium]
MEKIVIQGGRRLSGKVEIAGSKNAALPIMAASILAPGKSVLANVPALRDVSTMKQMLETLGASVSLDAGTLTIDAAGCDSFEAPYELVRTMRASVYVLGPLLARFKRARVSLPGGCAWGPRPVDLHLSAMRELGAEVDIEHGYIVASAEKLKGREIHFEISSVGATGNAMMAACLAEGRTVLRNAACEPEIEALAAFLTKMGANISGAGTTVIAIEGVRELKPAQDSVIPDRIEAGTYMVAAAITAGTVRVANCIPAHCVSVISKLAEAGVQVMQSDSELIVSASRRPESVAITTAPYPGFPTDMQAQMMALMCVAEGTSVFVENIYRDRFTHVPELRRMNADIKVEGNVATVRGMPALGSAQVMATDLRASAALILAGLIADGRTEVSRIYHIDRGYERIEKKLSALGAEIWREEA